MQQYLSQRQQKLKKIQRRTNNPEKIISEQLNDKKRNGHENDRSFFGTKNMKIYYEAFFVSICAGC